MKLSVVIVFSSFMYLVTESASYGMRPGQAGAIAAATRNARKRRAKAGYKPHYHSSYNSGSTCSPEGTEHNIAILDSSLKELVDDPAFSGESRFGELVNRISSMPTKEKIQAYYSVIGASQTTELLEFIYSRSNEQDRWADNISKNTGLDHDTATLLTGLIRESIKP